MKYFKLLPLLISGLLFITSCEKDEDSVEELQEVDPIQIMGNVEIPDNVPSEKIGVLQVSSGFYLNPVSDTQPDLGNRPYGGDKYCKIETLPNTVQVHTILNDDKPFMYGLSINVNSGDQIYFNVESTTVSLVLMGPLALTSEPTKAIVITEKIKTSPSFNDLKNEVKGLLINGSLNNMSPFIDVSTLPSYKRVVGETLSQLNDNSAIEQNGLQVIHNQKVGNEIQFRIRNYKKRYVTVYAHKYNGGDLENTTLRNTEGTWGQVPYGWVTSGEFSWVEAWMQIFSLQPEEQIIEDSDLYAVNTDNAEKIFIKCYGLGIADGSFPAFDSEDFERGSIALARTVVMDYVVPIVELVSGVNGIAKDVELNGEPNDNPLKKLFNRYFERLSTSPSFYNDISNAAISGQKVDVLKALLDETMDFIADEDNVDLYLELVKQKTNLSNPNLSNFASALSNYSMIKSAGDITGTSVNIAEAVYATLSSKWTTEIIMDVDGTLTPTDGLVAYYPFNGNANDESGNGNNGTVYGATLTTDRKGNPDNAYSFNGNGDYINFENSDDFNFSSSFSVSYWQYAKDITRRQFVMGKGRDIYPGSFSIFVNSFYTCYEYGDYGSIGSQTAVENQWQHITVVYDKVSGKKTFWVNGELADYIDWRTDFVVSNDFPLLMGKHIISSDGSSGPWPYYYEGLIDDVRFYNRALDSAEIRALYYE